MLSLRRISRGADMHVTATLAIRARSFGTKVPQDDADQGLAFALGQWLIRSQPIYNLATGSLTRSFTRITNFSPDQTSLTAHTFTSTRPAVKPILITSFSPRSVTIPEAFLGQLTHS